MKWNIRLAKQSEETQKEWFTHDPIEYNNKEYESNPDTNNMITKRSVHETILLGCDKSKRISTTSTNLITHVLSDHVKNIDKNKTKVTDRMPSIFTGDKLQVTGDRTLTMKLIQNISCNIKIWSSSTPLIFRVTYGGKEIKTQRKIICMNIYLYMTIYIKIGHEMWLFIKLKPIVGSYIAIQDENYIVILIYSFKFSLYVNICMYQLNDSIILRCMKIRSQFCFIIMVNQLMEVIL